MMNTYVALDIETTGLNSRTDKIIEIGALKVKDGRVTDTFETYVDPHRELDEYIKTLTGITDQTLKDAPDIDSVIGRFVDFCSDYPLIGHNIIFDFSFIKRAAVNHKLEYEKTAVDTLSLCRKFMPKDEPKNLDSACRYFGIKTGRLHRALNDAEASHMLYQKLIKEYEKDDTESFSGKMLIYKVKKDREASKKQKEHLRELIKYHRIDMAVDVDYMSGNEISRLTDKIISRYGRII